VWDEKKGKWVDKDAGDEEEQELAAPPTDSQLGSSRQLPLQPSATTAAAPESGGGGGEGAGPPAPSAAPPPATNAYSRQAMGRTGARSRYVDVLNPTGKNVGGASTQAPPTGISPPSFFVPQQPLHPPEGGEGPGPEPHTQPTPTTTTTTGGASTEPPAPGNTAQPNYQQHQQPQPAHGILSEPMRVPTTSNTSNHSLLTEYYLSQ
jgi:hypothetical protein